jgi:ribosomal protein L39E
MFEQFLPNKNKIATALNSNSAVPIWESKHGLMLLVANERNTDNLNNFHWIRYRIRALGLFGLKLLKFNSYHINVPSNAWSTKCRLIACMSAQIRSNLRDESIKPN